MFTSSRLLIALGTTLLLKVAMVIPALVLAEIIDSLSSSSPSSSTLLVIFLCLMAGQALLMPLQAWCLARLIQDRVRHLSINWCRNLLEKRFEAFGQLHGGVLVKVLDRGITAQERWLGFLIGSAWPILAEAAVLAGVFIYLGAGPVLIGLAVISMLYLLSNSALVRWRRPHIEAVNAREDELAEQWVDTFASATVIKLERAEAAAMRPVNQTLVQYADAAVCVATSGGWVQALKTLFIGLGSGGTLAWGMLDQASATPSLSLGELVALFTLTGGLLGGIAQLAEAWRMLDQFRVDKRKLEQWLRLPDFACASSAKGAPNEAPASLSLYPCSLNEGTEVRLLLSEALTICPGERVAIVGPSGAGKSTLLHALAGTLHPIRQHLHIDGRCVEEMDASSQFQKIRLCPQGARFIPGTFARAVLFDHDHDRSEVQSWLNRLGLESEWYLRELDGRGDSVSGGEAKRLSLMRLLNQPGAYNLFDEPTSGLDGPLAGKAWDLLFESLEGHSLVCVTHDQDALQRFDRIIRLKGGEIVAIETPIGS
ncbi:ATP-binding cassette subfamily B protein/ATP-binding cassette subfamily B protein RtxE/ATP-binding cassette subfamily C protein CydC [Pseudomonas hunanensis]|uniref:ATP-binding cassette subfamily B protein/ATP-binding cassette subfamily B protein RtxE/ATP-binding cassette subfamily C protein CydC n=1 Tax=Pseudomonas hunanensis TaxID=1247546 RepID=A0ACC6K0Z8_9PSED|nr:ABC transporter ATP-binding protein [Pseudomonas hunanensis]MDR6712067.1 ATP-binding cassette subfamily B protein/ATP-binding cassette subfamily B protein RtxE/ATP-binding cassette subfamily C protein CydC [Pseudomonas hunanensis]